MLFNSYQFLIFFPIVVLFYFIIPHKFRYIWLLAASYFFYMCWDAKYALILFFSTLITYTAGLLIGKTKNKKQKKLFVAISLILNLSILFFFKYFDFTIDNLNKILGTLNFQIITPAFDIVLPVGISFYIFQALGYTIDVYRKTVKPEKNFLYYALFVSFFPQLVAGPIERSKSLIKQLHEKHTFNMFRVKDGLLLMLWGYFQKIVIADHISTIADTIFNNSQSYPGVYVIIGAILFAFQIYCDFSGYTMIAIGAAKVMGFNLMENFNSPYMANSITDFWRRWHISLSTWFRDYLYIPLGGNRKGKLRKYINLMIVFLVSGLWHGANWSFVVWGGLNGLLQILGDALKTTRTKFLDVFQLSRTSAAHKALQILITFALIDLTWIFFRADSFTQATTMISSIFTTFNPWIIFDGSLDRLGLSHASLILSFLSILILIFADFVKWRGKSIRTWVYKQPTWFRWTFYLVSIFFVLIFGVWGASYSESAFLYFQF